jgi:hypothetical protein
MTYWAEAQPKGDPAMFHDMAALYKLANEPAWRAKQ